MSLSEVQAFILCDRCEEPEAPGMVRRTAWGLLCDSCYWHAYMKDEGEGHRWPSSDDTGF